MTSETLQKARDFETRYGPHIPDGERPAFHATPTSPNEDTIDDVVERCSQTGNNRRKRIL